MLWRRVAFTALVNQQPNPAREIFQPAYYSMPNDWYRNRHLTAASGRCRPRMHPVQATFEVATAIWIAETTLSTLSRRRPIETRTLWNDIDKGAQRSEASQPKAIWCDGYASPFARSSNCNSKADDESLVCQTPGLKGPSFIKSNSTFL